MCGDIRSLPRAPCFPLNHSIAGTEAKAQRLRLCNSSRHTKKSTLKSIETTWVWICTHKSIMIWEGVVEKSYRDVTTFLRSCSELPIGPKQKRLMSIVLLLLTLLDPEFDHHSFLLFSYSYHSYVMSPPSQSPELLFWIALYA